jgi:60 kDa SS-A/Ro ribonucleoprotein
MVKLIARRLRDEEQIRQARCFPYQLMVAYMNVKKEMPHEIQEALQDAMEIAVDNIPQYETEDGAPAKVWVFPDVSGSMGWAATGNRGTATSTVSCRHVASLVSACVLRRNPTAGIIPFASDCYDHLLRLNSRDSIMTNADKMAKLPSGGTNCSAPLRKLNNNNEKADLIIYVSDNESWMDSDRGSFYGSYYGSRSTSTQSEWERLKKRCPKAKMVCIDVVANTTTQAKEKKDVLNIGGFSDVVFDVVGNFVKHGNEAQHWVDIIEGQEV